MLIIIGKEKLSPTQRHGATKNTDSIYPTVFRGAQS